MNSESFDLKNKGYLDINVPENTDVVKEIDRLKREKNAIILAHYYQESGIQDIADYLGDSLGLSQKASRTDADIIVFAGVHFMAETAKILSPQKKVVLPDLNAGCSLAESAPADLFAEFRKKHPDHVVISYVNTSAEIKALSDVCCTSSNAVKIVESFPKDQNIIFAPDKNLGNYINSKTGREMLLWDGACHVHEQFSLEKILEIKENRPGSKVIAHPECEKPVIIASDFVGSTSHLLNFVKEDANSEYIVATEWGILHEMRRQVPEKHFIPAPPKDSTCACSGCSYMKLNTLNKLYIALKYEKPEISISNDLIEKARKPIEKMLEISKKQ